MGLKKELTSYFPIYGAKNSSLKNIHAWQLIYLHTQYKKLLLRFRFLGYNLFIKFCLSTNYKRIKTHTWLIAEESPK